MTPEAACFRVVRPYVRACVLSGGAVLRPACRRLVVFFCLHKGSSVAEWLLDSGAIRPGFKSQSRRCLRQTVHTHGASVHQAAKLVAAFLRVARVTAGLAESNGSLPPGL